MKKPLLHLFFPIVCKVCGVNYNLRACLNRVGFFFPSRVLIWIPESQMVSAQSPLLIPQLGRAMWGILRVSLAGIFVGIESFTGKILQIFSFHF